MSMVFWGDIQASRARVLKGLGLSSHHVLHRCASCQTYATNPAYSADIVTVAYQLQLASLTHSIAGGSAKHQALSGKHVVLFLIVPHTFSKGGAIWCREHLDLGLAVETFYKLARRKAPEDIRDAALLATTLRLPEDRLDASKLEIFGRKALRRSPETNMLWLPLLQVLLLWPQLRRVLEGAEPGRVLRALTHIKSRSGRKAADAIAKHLSPAWQVHPYSCQGVCAARSVCSFLCICPGCARLALRVATAHGVRLFESVGPVHKANVEGILSSC
jgi:hypothetical protein